MTRPEFGVKPKGDHCDAFWGNGGRKMLLMERHGSQYWTRAGFLSIAALAALLLIPSLEPVAWLLALLIVLIATGLTTVSIRARRDRNREARS